jgi:hypothetical protein
MTTDEANEPIAAIDAATEKPGSTARRGLVRRYFKRTPHPSIERNARMLIGLSVVIGLFAAALWLVGLTAMAAIVGGIAVVTLGYGLQELHYYRYRFTRAMRKPTDAVLDHLMHDDLRRASDRAMERLGLTDEMLAKHSADADPIGAAGLRKPRLAEQGQGPLVMFGPAPGSRGRIGADGTWRFVRNVVLVVCPTERHLGVFRCEVETAVGFPENEQTHEYFYGDVTALRTVTTPWGPFSMLGPTGYYDIDYAYGLNREFQITVPGSEPSSVVVGMREDGHPNQDVHLQDTGIEKVIEVLRGVLQVMK